MAHDEFLGTPIASRRIGTYRLSLRDYRAHTRLPPHVHGEAFVTIVVAGGFREESGGRSLDCGTHDVIVHAAGERHVNHFAGRDTRCLSVQGTAFERNALLASPAAAAIAVKVCREFRCPDALSPMVIEAMMLELFVASARHAETTRVPPWLVQARTILDQRFQESLTLTWLAQAVEVHPGHLARAFRRHYGTTVGDTLRELRLTHARRRLESAAALRDIAHDAGFADQSHFTRTFRRATGMTPAQYRRRLRTFQGTAPFKTGGPLDD
ncbi:MAG TPA: AraC family transcriptional regulator [Planctomycetota bacterium]|nr:AraC family transcriptional regulator [Planctomycetota bacterium]